MKIKIILTFIIIIGVYFNIYSQNTSKLTFTITDRVTGDKIKKIDSLIISDLKNKFIYKNLENKEGLYIIDKNKSGKYKLSIFNKGYIPLKNEIDIYFSNEQYFNLKLNPKTDTYSDSESNEDILLTIPEAMPEYPDGPDKLLSLIDKGINKDILRKYKKIMNTKFYLETVVDSTGKIKFYNIYENKEKIDVTDKIDLINEINNCLSKMKKFKPGQRNGKNANVKIMFKID